MPPPLAVDLEVKLDAMVIRTEMQFRHHRPALLVK